MGTAAVVEGEVAADPGRRVRDGVVGVQLDLFVLEGASFCEDVCGGLTDSVQLQAIKIKGAADGGTFSKIRPLAAATILNSTGSCNAR